MVYWILGILSFPGLRGESLYMQAPRCDIFRSSNTAFPSSLSYIGKDNEILRSSTYEFKDVLSFVCMLNKSGHRIDPCWTPCLTFRGLYLLCLILTYCLRSVRKLLNHLRVAEDTRHALSSCLPLPHRYICSSLVNVISLFSPPPPPQISPHFEWKKWNKPPFSNQPPPP